MKGLLFRNPRSAIRIFCLLTHCTHECLGASPFPDATSRGFFLQLLGVTVRDIEKRVDAIQCQSSRCSVNWDLAGDSTGDFEDCATTIMVAALVAAIRSCLLLFPFAARAQALLASHPSFAVSAAPMGIPKIGTLRPTLSLAALISDSSALITFLGILRIHGPNANSCPS